jgi:hypothetical protein
MWLGKFTHEFDGLLTESQALHLTFGAREIDKSHHPPPTATQRNELVAKNK